VYSALYILVYKLFITLRDLYPSIIDEINIRKYQKASLSRDLYIVVKPLQIPVLQENASQITIGSPKSSRKERPQPIYRQLLITFHD
jgi:hypothetical protein